MQLIQTTMAIHYEKQTMHDLLAVGNVYLTASSSREEHVLSSGEICTLKVAGFMEHWE